MDLQSCQQATVSPQSRENLTAAQAGRALPGQAGLTHHSWAMPSAKKGSSFLTNKLWAGCQLPVSEGRNAAPWRKAGPRHWKDLTLPGLVGFGECHRGSWCAQCTETNSDKSCLEQADEADFYKCWASKAFMQHLQSRQASI